MENADALDQLDLLSGKLEIGQIAPPSLQGTIVRFVWFGNIRTEMRSTSRSLFLRLGFGVRLGLLLPAVPCVDSNWGLRRSP